MKKVLFLFFFMINTFISLAYEDFSDLEGNTITYEELISYPKTILFLWRSSCYMCRVELKYLNETFTNCKNNEIKFFFVNLGEDKTQIKRFVEKMNLNECITKNIIFDKNAYLVYKFKIIGIPAFLFFKDGKVIYRSFYITDYLIKKVFKD